MKEIKVNALSPYSVIVTSTNSQLNFWLEHKKLNRLFVITDDNVDLLYGDYFNSIKSKIIGKYVLKAGEESKKIETVLDIYRCLLKHNIDRKCTILAFGGGVVGDITGFVASTFKRGTNLVYIPTTLIAQTDSSVGGKNGFNLDGIKNVIGTFYQPSLVYVDVNLLKTLDADNFKNGMAEVIKYGFVLDDNLFRYIEQNKRAILEREIDKLKYIVAECIKLKAAVVEKDELDLGGRHILNFGHTIGHALETISNFKIMHGEAVALGMVYESYIALKRNLIDQDLLERLIKILKYFDLQTTADIENYNDFKQAILKDKKNVDSLLKIVLPVGLGRAIITTDVKVDTIIQNMKELSRR
ncbi:3-dehydroquinate synthase [Thermobrachium celere]|uniref:3-dehydroquinate synthase n=1 Tax=Thermobrachium celere DSM 8682 TaxID=941824 RepID=R7RR78_9CLOT|nr:3-dehydroquinate synthase [Thermobrachium celere]CDF57861.1 3-dehydroquinate synthase [Thermobrachium celere DSM 8682]